MEPEASYYGSKDPATSAYPEPDECNPQTSILFKRLKSKSGNEIENRMN
jgi:hypothetical protein